MDAFFPGTSQQRLMEASLEERFQAISEAYAAHSHSSTHTHHNAAQWEALTDYMIQIANDCMWLHYGWATESYCQRIRMDKVWNKVWKIMKSWMECSCWVAELLRYQVLSDPKRRQDYDSRGRCQEGFIDAKVESWKINPKIPSFLHISWEISMISMSKARRYFNFHLYVYQSLINANIVACTISFYFLCLYLYLFASSDLLLPEVFFSVLLGADALVPYIGRLRRPKRTSQRCQVSRVSKKPKEQDGTSDTGIVFSIHMYLYDFVCISIF